MTGLKRDRVLKELKGIVYRSCCLRIIVLEERSQRWQSFWLEYRVGSWLHLPSMREKQVSSGALKINPVWKIINLKSHVKVKLAIKWFWA